MNASTRLSEHFSLAEAQITQNRNVDNTVPLALMPVLMITAAGMERVRACLRDKAIVVSSWFRCLELNRSLGSSDTSQHPKGEAVDFICPAYGSPLDIVRKLAENKILIRFDQLILEHSWVHISFNSIPGAVQKGEVLTLLQGGKTYAHGITDKLGIPV